MSDDRELLRRYAGERCEASFAALVQRHLDFVYNVALRRVHGDTHLAEDVVQLVFTDLARKAASVARHPSLPGWLHTSTRYAAAVLVRTEIRRRNRERTAHTMEAQNTPAAAVPVETLRPILDAALDQLAPADRHVLLLRFFGQQKLTAIAAQLGLSEAGTRKRLDGAIDRLRRQLSRQGLTTSAAALGLALEATPMVAAPPTLATAITVAALAGGAAAPAAGWLIFMSTLKLHAGLIAASLALGAVTFGAATLVEIHRAQDRETSQLAALESAADATAAARRRAARRAAPPVAPTPPAAAAVPAGASQEDILARSPEFAPFRRQELRLRVQREFGDFFAQRGYPAEHLEPLRAALALVFEAEETHRRTVRNAPSGTTVRPDATLVEETKLVLERVEAFLGPEESAALKTHLRQREQLPAVRNFAFDAADAGVPLTTAQQLALAGLVAETRQASRSAEARRADAIVDPASGLSALNQRLVRAAADLLSPEQMRAYEAYLRHERNQQAVEQRIYRAANGS